MTKNSRNLVALFTRAWIEINFFNFAVTQENQSPSSRGRGLKSETYVTNFNAVVALFTRAWIEMQTQILQTLRTLVALFTRAWIEIPNLLLNCRVAFVALFTRAWIEIYSGNAPEEDKP